MGERTLPKKMTKAEKDELMYRAADALYQLCKTYCSVPVKGIACYGQVRYCKGEVTDKLPCDRCHIGEKRSLAVKAMDATDYQANMRFDVVGILPKCEKAVKKYGKDWRKHLDEICSKAKAKAGKRNG